MPGCLRLKKGEKVKAFSYEPFKPRYATESTCYEGEKKVYNIQGLLVYNRKGEIELSFRFYNTSFKIEQSKKE